MTYGIPYKGSKNKIAKQIVDLLPGKTNFYDLFCGGCAVTHAALLSGKWQNYTINDIDPLMPEMFLKALNGDYRKERRWISREKFHAAKTTDPYIKTCWSFGNNGKNYLYSKEIEPWKRALHYAQIFKDNSILKSFGIDSDGSKEDIQQHEKEYKEKYIKWYIKTYFNADLNFEKMKENLEEKIEKSKEELRLYLCEALRKSGLKQSDVDRKLGNQMSGHYFGKSQWQFPKRDQYIKMQEFLPLPEPYESIYGMQELFENIRNLEKLPSLNNLHRLQNISNLERLNSLEAVTRLKRIQNLQNIQGNNKLSAFTLSYDEIKIKPDSVIYCDIPYKDTDEYTCGAFDHDKFYNWARKQKELCVISSYEMPEDFTEVARWERTSLLSSTSRKKVIEKLFIPGHQKNLFCLR